MRLVTIRTEHGTRAGRLDHDRVTELPYADVGELLAAGVLGERAAADVYGTEHALADVDLAPLVPRPSKIFCLGLNYASHIQETGTRPADPSDAVRQVRRVPASARATRSGSPRRSSAPTGRSSSRSSCGRRVRHASLDEARAAIAGYTICNDVSMRDWQYRTLQWLAGKTWEHSTPLGPALVTPDEVDDAADLVVRCEVDGEVMQEGRTSDLVFKPAETLAYISTIITLEPGDVVSTGTPGGIGDARDPPRLAAARAGRPHEHRGPRRVRQRVRSA